jgi:two-component system, cell cycle sensor histidine kinase and response regulator CckA
VLVVDDNLDSRELSCYVLRRAGFSVLTAGSGVEALEVWAEHADEIAVLLTDCMMGDISGSEIALQFVRQKPRLQVLFMSGHDAESLELGQPLDEKVNFIQKPFRAADLLALMNQALEHSEALGRVALDASAPRTRLR